MFGIHKGHSVESVEKGYQLVKHHVEHLIDEGILNMNKAQNKLVEASHCKMVLQEKRNSLLAEIDSVFGVLVQTLKQRKRELKGGCCLSKYGVGDSSGNMPPNVCIRLLFVSHIKPVSKFPKT